MRHCLKQDLSYTRFVRVHKDELSLLMFPNELNCLGVKLKFWIFSYFTFLGVHTLSIKHVERFATQFKVQSDNCPCTHLESLLHTVHTIIYVSCHRDTSIGVRCLFVQYLTKRSVASTAFTNLHIATWYKFKYSDFHLQFKLRAVTIFFKPQKWHPSPMFRDLVWLDTAEHKGTDICEKSARYF